MRFRSVIVEDEPLAVARLRRMLERHPEIEIVDTAGSVDAGLQVIRAQQPDLLFLDVQLPGADGFELLRRLPQPPPVIFTTAHDRYALAAFEATSIDYLLKPVEEAPLARAISKVRRLLGADARGQLEEQIQALLQRLATAAPQARVQRLGVTVGERTLLLDVADIVYFAAADKYVFAYTRSGKEHIVDHTLDDLEARLDPQAFLRIHRSTLVSLAHVREIQRWFGGKSRLVLDDAAGTVLEASKSRTQALRARLGV